MHKIPAIVPLGTAMFCFGSVLVGTIVHGIHLRKMGVRLLERTFSVGKSVVKCVLKGGCLSVYLNGDPVLASSRMVDIVLRKTVETPDGLLKIYYNGGTAVLDIHLNGVLVSRWPFGPVERVCVWLQILGPLSGCVFLTVMVFWYGFTNY